MSIHPELLDTGYNTKQAVISALQYGKVTKGDNVKHLTEVIKDFYDVDYCVLYGSGTIAMYVGIKAMVNRPKEEKSRAISQMSIEIPAFTYEPITWSLDRMGYNVRDIEEDTFHIKDQPTNSAYLMLMDTYGSLCPKPRNHNFEYTFVDACHSFGVKRKLRGICEVFSGNGGKLWTTGEGGILITNDKDIANFAERGKMIGRMPEMSAALGLDWFDKLDEILEQRRWIANFYNKHLDEEFIRQRIPIDTNNYIYAIKHPYASYLIQKYGEKYGLRQYYNPPMPYVTGDYPKNAYNVAIDHICLPIGYYEDPAPLIDDLNMENEKFKEMLEK